MPTHAAVAAEEDAALLCLRERLTWMDMAVCAQVDPELFFPPHRANHLGVLAKRICARCPVRAECLRYALTDPELDGIWGGTTPRERQRLRRSR